MIPVIDDSWNKCYIYHSILMFIVGELRVGAGEGLRSDKSVMLRIR